MSHLRYALTIAFIPLFQIVVPAQQAAIALDKNDPELLAILAEIVDDVESARVKEHIPGLSIDIVYDQDVLLATGLGYADFEKKTPADPQTVYRVGSVTKVFTALMLMQLRDAGKLQLDDPIEKYVPEFTIKSQFPDARPATFRQVAAHYSGLQREAPMTHECQLVEEFPSVEEELKSLKNVEMVLPALTIYNYSNLGYDILGLALSRAAQQPYDLYVVDHILKPLGMNDSGFALSEQMKSHLAIGYSARPDGTYERSSYQKCGMASGMLYSTADDLAKYLSLFFREGPAGGKQVLGSSSLREMLMPVAVSPDWTYGSTIGFSVNPFPEGTRQMQQIHYKPGGCAGFSSVVIINYQRKLGMALLTNTYTPTDEKPDPFWIGYPLLRKLTPVLVKSLERTEDQMRKEMLPRWQTYTGRYVITDTSAVRILTFSEYDVSIKNQKLVVNVPELLPGSFVYMKEIPLSPYGENVFRVGGSSFGGDLMTFESNEDGSMMLKWRNYSFKRQP